MAQFGINPAKLQLSEWADLYSKAHWLESWRLRNQAEMMVRLFREGEED